MSKYKPGDTVRIAITGKVERVRGDAVVVAAHGVEIPIMASQIEASWSAIGPLWQIAQAVATTDTTYSTGMGSLECVFCNGHEDYENLTKFIHDQDCVVMKARKLVEEQQNQ